jgi:hypothetical protein
MPILPNLVPLRGTAAKADVTRPETRIPSPEKEQGGFPGKTRIFFLLALLVVSAGTFLLGRYLFFSPAGAAPAFRVTDCGIVTGKSSRVNEAGETQYYLTYDRPDQSPVTRQVSAQLYRSRGSGQSICFFEPSFLSGGLVVLFFLGMLAVVVLLIGFPAGPTK